MIKNGKKTYKDLTGKRFEKLVALYPTDERLDGSVVWHCCCDCGNELNVSGRYLTRGYKTHCGCSKKPRKNPRYRDLKGRRFGKLLVLQRTDKRINGSVVWECACDCGNTAFASENNLVHGHQKSCGCAKQMAMKEIHTHLHFVGDTCIEFLKRKKRRDNTSGYVGIHVLKNGRFRANIGFKKKRYYLGTYDTLGEALDARMEAEMNLHKKFLKEYSEYQ